MSLAPRLDLRQSQQLVMTPQLQQAIKLLQLNNLELEAHLEAELEANLLLEIDRGPGDGAGEADAPEPERDPAPDTGPAEERAADDAFAEGSPADEGALDSDAAADTFHHTADAAGPGAGSGGDEPAEIDSFADTHMTLSLHLERQAAAELSGTNLAVARYLIDQIDGGGYLRGASADVAAALGVTVARVEAIVRLIQAFDPAGVGARTLAECLAIQARESGRLDRAMRLLLRNLELLARGDLPALRRIVGLGAPELQGYIRYLRSLDPKPGARFGETANPVAPDIFLRRTTAGWSIELNGATLPRVLVNHQYQTRLLRTAEGAARTFLTECAASASWLTKALDQRARTIVAVTSEIVRQQEAFFLHGVHHLRPLTMKAVASVVGLHESTISRATSNKYLGCERGLFELKYFFTPALASVGVGVDAAVEGGVSTTAVKRRIADLIAGETPASVLSDDQLVDRLRADGFDVARRTVAKYREGLGLGSSVQRRRRFALAG